MEWLVKEIQVDILNNESITNILRKTLVLYKKLNLKDIEFIEKELNGYNEDDEIPDYRIIIWYRILWWNPYNWWILANIDNDELFDKLVTKKNYEPISKIEWLVKWWHIKLPNEFMGKIMSFKTEYKVDVSGGEFRKTIESVKNIILDKCIELEKKWILWEWISFTKEEIEKAKSINNTTNNFYSAISNSNLQVGANNSTQQNITNRLDYNKIKEIIEQVEWFWKKIEEIPQNDKIVSCFEDIKNELNKKSPNDKGIIKNLVSIKAILSWATWNLLATWILGAINLINN